MLAALVPHQSVFIDGVCNSLAVGSWGGLRYRSLHEGRNTLHSTRWAGIPWYSQQDLPIAPGQTVAS